MRHNFTSPSAASWSLRRRNSFVEPTFQPAALSRLAFAAFMLSPLSGLLVAPQPLAAPFQNGFRGFRPCFWEHVENHDRVRPDAIHNPPGPVRVLHPQFVAGI